MLNIIDDIGAAVTEFCLCASEPDLFIRDNLGDTGKEPSTGSLSRSPDIIVRKSAVADPGLDFGNIAVDPGSDKVEIGNDNYLYVRVFNRGGQNTDATVRIYFAPLTTSCSPASWEFIEEIDVTNIPAGGVKVSGTIVWPNVPNPGTANHFCLIAVYGNTIDPFPDTGMINSADDFIKFMNSSNNIAYRNVTFENVLPDTWAEIPFIMQGFPGDMKFYDLVIDASELPQGSQIEMKMPRRLLRTRRLELKNIGKLKSSRFKWSGLFCREVVLRIFKGSSAVMGNLKIPTGKAPPSVLSVKLSRNAKTGHQYPVRLIQKLGDHDLGHITVLLKTIDK